MSYARFLMVYFSITEKYASEDEECAFAEYCARTDGYKAHKELRDLGDFRSEWNEYINEYN